MNSKELNNKFEISKVYMSDYTIRWKRYKVQGLEHLSLRQRLNSFKSLEQGVKSALIIMYIWFAAYLIIIFNFKPDFQIFVCRD